jgi:hypothetical protein
MKRSALIVALFVVYASAMRLTGQAPGGVGARARDPRQATGRRTWR